MNQNEPLPCCVNCSISGVPLYLGLDGKLHCADHIGLLLNPSKQNPRPDKKPERSVTHAERIKDHSGLSSGAPAAG